MRIVDEIEERVEKYYDSHGKDPKYIIFNNETYMKFTEQIRNDREVFTSVLGYDKYDLMTVCTTNASDVKDFELA